MKLLLYQVRNNVVYIRNELPPDIQGPNFNDEFGDVYSALYMLTGEGLSYADLKARAEDIRQATQEPPRMQMPQPQPQPQPQMRAPSRDEGPQRGRQDGVPVRQEKRGEPPRQMER